MEPIKEEKEIYQLFRLSLFLKGAASFLEILGGILVFVIPPAFITNIVITLTRPELAEEPGDFIATHLVTLAQQFAVSSTVFIALYLLSRGIIKLGLILALFKNKLWAYPISLVVLGLFVLYQIYQIFTSHSLLIVGLTIFDLVVMYFIWREYRIVKEHLHHR